jgi:hypothetical protein
MHAGGDDSRLGGDVVIVTDVQVGGVQVHVGEPGAVETPRAEGLDVLVEAPADPGHFRPADPRVHPKGRQHVVDQAGQDPLHVGLHDDEVEVLVDPPPEFEDRGEEAALSQLRDPDLDVPGLRGKRP